MVSGDRAEIRGLNLEGLRRRGFSVVEVHFSLIINTWWLSNGGGYCAGILFEFLQVSYIFVLNLEYYCTNYFHTRLKQK